MWFIEEWELKFQSGVPKFKAKDELIYSKRYLIDKP